MNYRLKVLHILVRDDGVREQIGELALRLREDQIEVVWEDFDSALNVMMQDAEGVLWLTDHADSFRRLRAQSQAVLVCLHEGNRDQDFSQAMYACEQPGELDGKYLEQVYRRSRNIPWDILDTARCHIRETVEEDLEAFYRIYGDPSITKYMEDLHPDMEQERCYLRAYREKVYAFYGFGMWTVELKETGEVIGRAGLSYREGFPEPELGYVIGVPWQGRGIATEVCQAILEHARCELGFSTIQALVEPENTASIHLLRDKLGFHQEGETMVHDKLHQVWYTDRLP